MLKSIKGTELKKTITITFSITKEIEKNVNP